MGAEIKAMGDDATTVWRGDYGFARVIGMAPNNDIRQPVAKSIAEQRSDSNQITNLYDDLAKLEGNAVGRQYICTTSDLALLTSNFAGDNKQREVNLGSFPGMIRDRILAWVESSDKLTPEERKAERKAAEARGDSLIPAEDGGMEIRDAFGIPGTILEITMIDKSTAKIRVTAHRKAFRMVVDKDSLLPGLYALGGPMFVHEQELHGLERVYPWQIKGTHTVEALREEFPIQDEKDKKDKEKDNESR
jgi:hypothetical protein